MRLALVRRRALPGVGAGGSTIDSADRRVHASGRRPRDSHPTDGTSEAPLDRDDSLRCGRVTRFAP